VSLPFLKKSFKFFIFTVIFAGAFFGGLGMYVLGNYSVDFSVLEQYDPGAPSLLLDDQENEWGRFQLDRRQLVVLSHLPQDLIHAFVAAEDWKFFEHSGISFKGIIRSTAVNLYHGSIVQGASTITQQLVKLLFLDSQRTFKRKFQEQFYSLLVEHQFTKEQILETYLNHVYFGNGIYGVEAAAQRFWGISSSQLSLAQSAMLAGIVRSPGHYCPLWFPLSAVKRRNIVLRQMSKCKFIAPQECTHAQQEVLHLVELSESVFAPHAKETIRVHLEGLFGKQQLYAGGLRIKTTLNRHAQEHAQRAFCQEITRLKKEVGSDVDGALLSMDSKTGQIRAMIGGTSFAHSQFNRALQAHRQQGSVFKPLVYAAAMEVGITFLDIAVDEPFVLQQGLQVWEPQNYNLRFEGPMTLARALSYSNNIVTIKTILAVGPQKVVDLAKRCRVKGSLKPYPSLALGCVDSTVSEVAGMFNIFANDGVYITPHILDWVKDKWGKKIYRVQLEKEAVIAPRIAHQVMQVLSYGLEKQRKRVTEWIDSDAISKTGTTNDSRTCWFAGSTPELTTVTYIGFDDNHSMGQNVFPLYTAYPLWLAYHKDIRTKRKSFSHDSSLISLYADIKTGKIAPKGSGSHVFELLV